MTISKVDSILSKHPFFKTLTTNQKIGIYNKIYTKIFYIRSNITVINTTTYSSDKSYLLYHENPEDVNLSAHRDVDSLMNEHSLLSGLTDAQKIAVFEIAAYRINMYRTLREDQEYYFSTHKQDTTTIRKYSYQPLLSSVASVLVQTVRSYIFSPIATVTGSVLALLSHSNIFQPLLTATKRILSFLNTTSTHIPLLTVTTSVLPVVVRTITNTYTALLQATSSIVSLGQVNTYVPSLAVSSEVLDISYL